MITSKPQWTCGYKYVYVTAMATKRLKLYILSNLLGYYSLNEMVFSPEPEAAFLHWSLTPVQCRLTSTIPESTYSYATFANAYLHASVWLRDAATALRRSKCSPARPHLCLSAGCSHHMLSGCGYLTSVFRRGYTRSSCAAC